MPRSSNSIDLRTNHHLKPQLTGEFTLLARPGNLASRSQSTRPSPDPVQKGVSQDRWKRASWSQAPDARLDLFYEGPRIGTGNMPGDRHSVSLNGESQSKRRTQYYEEQFQYKDNVNSSARERVHRESPVIAELRTNVIVRGSCEEITEHQALTDCPDQR